MKSLIILTLLTLFSRRVYGQVCGAELQSISVKTFSSNDLSSLAGEWFLLGFIDSKNVIYNETQCIHFHYYPNEDGSINVTKHQRLCNQSKEQIEQKITLTKNNNINYISDMNDPSMFHVFRIINFDVTDSNINNHFLIYYSCDENPDGSKRTIFEMVTREFAQGPNMNVLEQELRSLKQMRELENRKGYLKVFGDVCGCKEEDPIWTTTTTEADDSE